MPCVSNRISTFMGLLSPFALMVGLSLSAQSYQSSFSEVKFDRAKTPKAFHGGLEVDAPTGAVSIRVPLGPGIGARGAEYHPAINMRFAPTAMATLHYERDGGQTPWYGPPPHQMPFWNPPGGVPSDAPAIASWGGTQTVSLVNKLTSEDGFTMSPGEVAYVLGRCRTLTYTTPGGESGTLSARNLPGVLDNAGLLRLVSRYGYDANNWEPIYVNNSPGYTGGMGEIAVALRRKSNPLKVLLQVTAEGKDVCTLQGMEGSGGNPLLTIPELLIVIRDNVAFEYNYDRTVYTRIARKKEDTGWGSEYPQAVYQEDGQLPIFDRPVCLLRLKRIINLQRERIRFDYNYSPESQIRPIGFVAHWFGDAIEGDSLSKIDCVYKSHLKYLDAKLPFNFTFNGVGRQTFDSYKPAFDPYLSDSFVSLVTGTDGVSQGDYIAHTWPSLLGSIVNNDPVAPETISFEYQMSNFGAITEPGHSILRAVNFPGRRVELEWGSYSYRRNAADGHASFVDSWFGYVGRDDVVGIGNPRVTDIVAGAWKAWFLGVNKIIETIPGAAPRVTTHDRMVPKPIWTTACLWETACFEFKDTITHPDGSVKIHYFVNPINTGRSGGGNPFITNNTSDSIDEYMQTLAHLKHMPYCVEEFPPQTADLNRNNAIRVTYFDRWDLRGIGNHLGDFRQSSVPYPTRTRVWDKNLGRCEETESLHWDAVHRGWKTTRKIIIPWDGNGIPTPISIDITSLAMRDFQTPVVSGNKILFETMRKFDSVPSEWIWGRISELSETRKDGSGNSLSLPPLTYTYDSTAPAFNRLSSVRKGNGSGPYISTTYTYKGDSGPQATQIDNVVLTGQEASGLPMRLSGQVGIAGYQYDQFGFTKTIQPKGVDWDLEQVNDASARPHSQKDPSDLETTFAWDEAGRLKSIVPPGEMGITHIPDQDLLGVSIVRGDQESKLRYNGLGKVILEARKNGAGTWSHRRFGYDTSDRLSWETVWIEGEGGGGDSGWESPLTIGDKEATSKLVCDEWVFSHDPNQPAYCASWSVQQIPASFGSQATHFEYDTRGRLVKVTNPNGQVTTTQYDVGGSALVSVKTVYPTQLKPIKTRIERDLFGRVSKITDAMNQSTEYQYDLADRCTRVTQWGEVGGTVLEQTRTWGYDPLGRLVSLTQPESGTTHYSDFDVSGKPWTTVYGYGGSNPRTVATMFDGIGRVKAINSTSDTSVAQAFAYDESDRGCSNGKLTTAMANGVNRSLFYGGPNGRLDALKRSVDGLSFDQFFEYDTYGRMTRRTYPDGKVQDVDYQNATNLPNYSNFVGTRLANFHYDDVSWNLDLLAYQGAANGASSTFTYRADQVGLASLNHAIPGKSFSKAWTYAYDGAGRLTTDGVDYFSYDDLGRLNGAFVRDPLDTAAGNANRGLMQTFGYDAFGNRITASTKTLTAWTANAKPMGTMSPTTTLRAGLNTVTANMSFSASDPALLKNQMPATATTGAHYDPQGNLDRVYTTPGDTTTQVSMTYDALARVTAMTSKAGSEQYLYDDEGLRIRIWDGTKYRYNIYNEARQLIAQYEKTPTGSLTWKKDIIYVGTKEIAEVSPTATSITMTDHLGSPRFIWAGGTNPVIKQKFLPFGESLTLPTDAAGISKGFTNHEQTDASGLIYMQARFYLPMWGRFASPDPARDQHFEQTQSWNIYSYVRNNPVMMTDPTGMVAITPDDEEVLSPNARKLQSMMPNPSRVPVAGQGGLLVINFLNEVAKAGAETLADTPGDLFAVVTGRTIMGDKVDRRFAAAAMCIPFVPATIGKASKHLPFSKMINIGDRGISHVLERHVAGGAKSADASIFYGGKDEVKALIKGAESVTPTLQRNGNLNRIVEAAHDIGIDRNTGKATREYTVITTKKGDLVTAFPGR